MQLLVVIATVRPFLAPYYNYYLVTNFAHERFLIGLYCNTQTHTTLTHAYNVYYTSLIQKSVIFFPIDS